MWLIFLCMLIGKRRRTIYWPNRLTRKFILKLLAFNLNLDLEWIRKAILANLVIVLLLLQFKFSLPLPFTVILPSFSFAAGIVIENKNWPPFMPIIHHDISNEIPIHLQRMQYLAFCSLLGKFGSCFDSPSPSCGNTMSKYLATPFVDLYKHYSYWGPRINTLSKQWTYFPWIMWLPHYLPECESDIVFSEVIWENRMIFQDNFG